MAPLKLLLFSALFFPLLPLMVPSHCLVNPGCTTPAICHATSTICGINASSEHHTMQCARLPEYIDLSAVVLSKISPGVCVPNEAFCSCGKNVQVFSFKELEIATNNFRKRLDSTDFFSVFQGQLSDGRLVAVKHYNNHFFREQWFQTELEILSKTRHENVIDLIGYCRENDEWLLVFEFTSCSNLHKHLHPDHWEPRSMLLYSWKLRVKILLDIAKGIEYLHRYAKSQISHGDIASYHILIDENWVAKISNFEVAKLGPESEIHNEGYERYMVASWWDEVAVAEYHYLRSTPSNDVYKFGVLMLEMFTGKEVYDELASSMRLVDFAETALLHGRFRSLLDNRLPVPKGWQFDIVNELARLAIWCTRTIELQNPKIPNLRVVVLKLERALVLFDHAS